MLTGVVDDALALGDVAGKMGVDPTIVEGEAVGPRGMAAMQIPYGESTDLNRKHEPNDLTHLQLPPLRLTSKLLTPGIIPNPIAWVQAEVWAIEPSFATNPVIVTVDLADDLWYCSLIAFRNIVRERTVLLWEGNTMRSLSGRFVASALLVTGLLFGASTHAIANDPLSHPVFGMYSAYQGDAQDNARIWSGYLGMGMESGTLAYPAVLKITPGDSWANYVSASRAGVSYSTMNVTLAKTTPSPTRCSDTFPGFTIVQEGTANIRLNWPLVYEAPGTTWTLTIAYRTATWDDDGSGPNLASTTHQDVWTWTLGSDIAHLRQLVMLFHDVAFGKSEVPVLGDEVLYASLLDTISRAQAEEDASDYGAARAILEQFRTAVQDACVSTPGPPSPTGGGIAGSTENPGCCKLQLEVDYILSHAPYVGGSSSASVARAKEQKAPAIPVSDTAPTVGVTNTPVAHPPWIALSALSGNSAGNPVEYRGFDGAVSGAVAFPGVIGISPGANWSNFIGAAQQGLTYTVMGVSLVREAPQPHICSDVFPGGRLRQDGASNIRLWWPVMYEVAGTRWTLTITYKTSQLWDDDGYGPNLLATVHQDVWTWQLEANIQTLSAEVDLFHSLPLGTSEVPLISDESLYPILQDDLAIAETMEPWDPEFVALSDAEGRIDVSVRSSHPTSPMPTGAETGIAQTEENPTAYKLLLDFEWSCMALGVRNPATGGSTTTHPTVSVNSSYQGSPEGATRVFAGYDSSPSGGAAYPGVLNIVPGNNWSNYIGASAAGIPYTFAGDAVSLRKTTPSYVCMVPIGGNSILQAMSPNIQLQWPLAYSIPGTAWQLTILYETPIPWDDDGAGPNPACYLHSEVWTWEVTATLQSLSSHLDLFHDMPAGNCQVPLINGGGLYGALKGYVEALEGMDPADPEMYEVFYGFILTIEDNCLSVACGECTSEIGIRNTVENPAGCALLAEADYIAETLGPGGDMTPRPAARKQSTATVTMASSAIATTAGEGGSIIHPSVMILGASPGDSGGAPTAYLGYNGTQSDPVSFPGVLGLSPGADWSHFVAAAQREVPYTLDDVTLAKQVPDYVCTRPVGGASVLQQGNANIRTWWPLLYDIPQTTFVLTVTYHTDTQQQFAGELAPSLDHQEIWQWRVGASLSGLSDMVDAFHALPAGSCDTPLINGEDLYAYIREIVETLEIMDPADPEFNDILYMLILVVEDNCLTVDCGECMPYWQGIRNTSENPAGCCLLAYIEDLAIGWQTYGSVGEMASSASVGKAVALAPTMVVTLLGDGWLYMQDTNRCGGIKVIGDAQGIVPGALVSVRGILDTDGPERILRTPYWDIVASSGGLPRALGMRSQAVGGSGRGYLPGFPGAGGLWNGGLRVMVTGTVAAIGTGFFYLDDGAACRNGTEYPGVRISLPTGTNAPDVGSHVRVVGVSSWCGVNGGPYPAVIVGSGDDITPYD